MRKPEIREVLDLGWPQKLAATLAASEAVGGDGDMAAVLETCTGCVPWKPETFPYLPGRPGSC